MSARGERGLSLAEMLVSLTVLMILTGVAVPGVLRMAEIREERALERQAREISLGLDAYFRDVGVFPSTGQGLEALISRPSGAGGWQGPYLHTTASEKAPWIDPRGNAMEYRRASGIARLSTDGFPDWSREIHASAIERDWAARAHEELGLVAEAAERFRRGSGSYPGAVGDLHPGYLGEDLTLDPWGAPYEIDTMQRVPWSRGPDGRVGTDDDIFPPGYDVAALPPRIDPPPVGP